MAEGEEHEALLNEGPVPPAHRKLSLLSALSDPQRLPHRLVVLSLMCFLGFGESVKADPALGSPGTLEFSSL